MIKLIVLGGALILIGVIVWWFFGHHQERQEDATMENAQQIIDVNVEGGYSPSHLVFQQGTPAAIHFTRKDPSSCLEEVVIPDFGVKRTLPINQAETVEIDTTKTGKFQFSCGMNMFHGEIVVE